VKLRQLVLRRYRQFVGETLNIDPSVTVIVGRNDTGKTGLLGHYFDHYLVPRTLFGTDAPLSLPKEEATAVAFSHRWDVAPDDAGRYPLVDAFGRPDVRRIDVAFDGNRSRGEQWTFCADGVPAVVHGELGESGWPIARTVFLEGRLFPQPHFISIGDRRLIPQHFEARFYELSANETEVVRIRDLIPLEALLLRLAGLRAYTRPQRGKGTEEPWETSTHPSTPVFAPGEVDTRLRKLAQRITDILREWWDEPSDLTFHLRLVTDNDASYRRNSHLIEWSITDGGRTPRYGAGLSWFIAFIVELLYLEEQTEPQLLLLDEPAAPLHPGMQKRAVRLINSLAKRHQTIYSTHSPFLIDWSFPQRLRLFEHDYRGKRTRINNRPHADPEGAGIWDPLRRSVGVSLGDVTGLSSGNVLVEGVTEQILLANAAEFFASKGRVHLDLAKVSIVPYGKEPALQWLLSMIQARRYKAVVLADSDEQGKKVVTACRKASIPFIEIREYASEYAAECASIEDVVGTDAYVGYVNEFYGRFEWFRPFDPAEIRRALSESSPSLTLGKFLEDEFTRRFRDRDFGKVAVVTEIANRIAGLPADTLDRIERLLLKIREALV
jgi:hypothetical protein